MRTKRERIFVISYYNMNISPFAKLYPHVSLALLRLLVRRPFRRIQRHDLTIHIQACQFRPRIMLASVREPPRCRDDETSDEDDAVVVHRRYQRREGVCCAGRVSERSLRRRVGVRTEAEHDVEENDQEDGYGVDEVAQGAHPEWPWRNVPPSCEKVGTDC